MKSDLDALMKAANLDAIVVLGNAQNNPPMYYFTGAGHISHAALFKKQGQPPVIYCNAMERAEAAKSGLEVRPQRIGVVEILARQPKEIFEERGLTSGRIAIYGTIDAGDLLSMVAALREAFPDLQVVGEPQDESIFLRAMETKDEQEVAHIRQMGKVTTEVVGMVAKYLTERDVRDDEVLLKEDGSPLTVGDVKSKISLWLAERGAADVEGTIFAIGRDAGVPHSIGTPTDPMRLGQTIVFDIFPEEAGGGYFYDFTRTWSLGYATPEAQKLYDEVHTVYDKVVDNLDLNVGFKEYQKLVCDEFNKNSHKTQMHVEGILEEGYVHSLGHGVGLNIHERPSSRHTAPDDNVLKAGVVVTIEPGLYYSEMGGGIRLEDVALITNNGPRNLTRFEKVLEV